MKSVDPEKTEIALGNRQIDVRTVWRSTANKFDTDLGLAKAYWLKTIQPYIAGRNLHGVEFFIADEAHEWLRMMADLATQWNNSEAGKKAPIPAVIFPEWEKTEFHKPKELFADENLKPEILAAIAAPLINANREKMSPTEAVRTAHDLLLAAKQYISSLPKHEQNKPATIKEANELAFRKVTFEEILKSNEKDSGHLPLLPPVQQKRNAGSLTMNAIKTAVKHFLEKRNPTKEYNPSVTQEDYEREEENFKRLVKKGDEDKAAGRPFETFFRAGNGRVLTYQEWQKQNRDSINDCLENNQISFRIVSTMRWDRFKSYWQDQQSRTNKREAAKSQKLTSMGRQKR
jgi:hypothetical protein